MAYEFYDNFEDARTWASNSTVHSDKPTYYLEFHFKNQGIGYYEYPEILPRFSIPIKESDGRIIVIKFGITNEVNDMGFPIYVEI